MNIDRKHNLWELTRGQRARYGAAIAAMALSILFAFGVPLVIMSSIDGLFGFGELDDPGRLERTAAALSESVGLTHALWIAAALVVGLTACSGLFEYLHGRWAAMASENITRGVRDRLYHHLTRLSCSWHDAADTGDLVQRCTSDVETVRVFLSNQVVTIARSALLLLTVIPILFWLDWRMALVSLVLFPPIIAFAVFFFRRVKALFLASDEAEGRMTAVLQENLTGIRVVRAFARQEFETDKFGGANAEFRDKNYRLIQILGTYWSLSDLLCLGQSGLVLFFGAHWALGGSLTVGALFAFMSYESMVIWPVRHMGRVLTDTGKAVVSLTRLSEVLSAEEEDAADELYGAEPEKLTGELVVDGLGHAYGDGPPVLRELSFRLRAGETLALIGPPGSGKTTLVNLLLRLYDYNTGSIRVDGHELSSLSRPFVRSQIGAVLQEPFLYSKTIRQNLQLGRRQASEEEVVGSASAACVHEAITEFTEGYETFVGERGVTLSGGQRQRVALARALLKDPPILVLDDSLSAVDTRTEAQILDALRQRRGRHTTILIAHRLSSVLHADQILVLEHGQVVQAGTHAELSSRPGAYRRLWAIQGALEEEIRHEAQQRPPAAAGSERRRR